MEKVIDPNKKEHVFYLKNPLQETEIKTFSKNIEIRASETYKELKQAWQFSYVLPNHDGEDSENWDAFYYPLGDARRALLAFVSLLSGETPPGVEKWEDDLIP